MIPLVKLLSLKRQKKIGMIHFNCFQPKHMATYVVGARKTVSRDFSFEHPKYKGSVDCRSAFFFQNSAFRAGKFYLICL